MTTRARTLAVPAADATADLMAWRRAALWGLLAAKLISGWGVGWDIQWHILIGRDSFWIPPHVMIYAGVAVAVLISFGTLARETLLVRRGAVPVDSGPPLIRIAGLVGTRGFHLAAGGILVTVLAAPIDDLWHRLFGIDVTLWSPPHLLGLAGSQVNTLGCMLIAVEIWPAASRARLAALLVAGSFLFGGFHLAVDPSIRIAYLHGGVLYFTYAILGACLFAFTFVYTARLTRRRWAPVVVAAGLIVLHLGGMLIATIGFDVLQPTSVIDEVIKGDTTSPIAVAHIMALKSGTSPGRGSALLRFLPLIPAALLLWLDPRRWAAASILFGAGLFVVSGFVLSIRPALQHALPGPADVALALPLTLLAALVGGSTADVLTRNRLIGRTHRQRE